MKWIYLYDEDAGETRTSRRQLLKHEIADTSLSSFGNRIALFDAIAANQEVVVALIDLQSDDRTDNNYSGHRVIETIRRNPALAVRCRPIAYTVHARDDIIEMAREHGARALISKDDLEVPAAEISEVNLAGFLAEQRRLEASPLGQDAAGEDSFSVFPGAQRATEHWKNQELELARALEGVMQGSPRIVRRPYFWHVVRYLAEGIGSSSVADWIHTDFLASARTVKNDLDELRGYLEPRYLVHGVAWAEFARDLLEAAPQKRRAPTDLEMVRVLQRIGALQDILHDPEIREKSYLDTAALVAIDRVVDPRVGIGRRLGNSGDRHHVEDVLARLAAVEPEEGARRTLQVDFVRAVSNMYDTYMAAQPRD
jgi:CheY-like chemotaxis protein